MPTLYTLHFDENHAGGAPGRDCVANINEMTRFVQRSILDQQAVFLRDIPINQIAPLPDNIQIPAGSIIVLHGHGGEDVEPAISYDAHDEHQPGVTVTTDDVLVRLRPVLANNGNGVTIYCVVCYSALLGHIAPRIHQTFNNSLVFGTRGEHGGALATGVGRPNPRWRAFNFVGQMEEV